MNRSYETEARHIIQRIRPSAKKHGLQRAVVETYLRENLPKKYRGATWEEMKHARDYTAVREEAEYYRPPFNTDLSEIYPEDREIILFEIEDRSPVTPERRRLIEYWQGFTMDGWDWWDVVLITTNRYGLGWDILIDTKKGGHDDNRWRNWQLPEMKDFLQIRNSISLI
jgi:hypothetical protein